jgi:hypothetical protein
MTINYAKPGSIIQGTLRNENLLKAFADALEACIEANPDLPTNGGAALNLISDAREVQPHSELASELVVELVDALNEYAPAGHYFGSREDDDSNFGFWPGEEDERY